ncbi:hypothetical protein [Lysobacter sp. TY2-98]|uniref:hypothetical protein n=1 Tax=Lysobacter sp. TY2-98 TaxID=2290922 RepID=UPI0013B41901|nr:hypothetical protein [Lysobacter sp. TY2-98]
MRTRIVRDARHGPENRRSTGNRTARTHPSLPHSGSAVRIDGARRRGPDPRRDTGTHKEMDVSHNPIAMELSDDHLHSVRSALDRLEAALPALVTLDPAERRLLTPMEAKSEAFARQTLRVLEHNPKIVPTGFDVAAAQADLRAVERLRPVLERVQQLAARLDDTVAALGSDVMDSAFEGYALIKLSGGALGLDELRRELSGRARHDRRRPTESA